MAVSTHTADIYTFFRKKPLSFDGIVFSGEHSKNPQKENGTPPIYHINVGNRSLELLEQKTGGMEAVVTGGFEGHSQSKALLRTKNSLASARTNHRFSRGWTFVYLSSEYKWSVSAMSSKWTLTDVNKKVVVAFFKRSSLKLMQIGTLSIYHDSDTGMPIDPEFIALIVFTCKMVHYTNEVYEMAAVS
ncbi:hypothetical protein IWW48_003294 [Coemansia sp. RSA 1200]|nr:hypothetical protein IWW48_003294 [Coemansia sp. RSA 1200]